MKRSLIVLAMIAAWAIPASTDAVNSLTPKEAAQGWKLLIGLQHTGQTIEFRNFKIKTL